MAHLLDVTADAEPMLSDCGRYQSGERVKRALDVTGAVLGLIVLGPLFLIIMLIIKIADGGAVFYGHKRVGRYDSEFSCLKFRTMVQNGDEVLQAHFAANPEARGEWIATRKLREDPRVTAIGVILRKFSLDELPQLLNVLRGEMSLVGPRPVVRDELALYGAHASAYLVSRPGLTGLWQVSGRSNTSFDARVAFDRSYVAEWSLAKDIMIIAKTVPAVCMSRGAY